MGALSTPDEGDFTIETGEGDFTSVTVFGPTNAAFDALPENVLDCLFKPKYVEDLQGVLLYHAAGGEYLAPQLANGDYEYIEMVWEDAILITVNNTAPIDNGAVVINGYSSSADAFLPLAKVVSPANVMASNGVVHAIDRVLLPNGT